jgi:hypothetical protein
MIQVVFCSITNGLGPRRRVLKTARDFVKEASTTTSKFTLNLCQHENPRLNKAGLIPAFA